MVLKPLLQKLFHYEEYELQTSIPKSSVLRKVAEISEYNVIGELFYRSMVIGDEFKISCYGRTGFGTGRTNGVNAFGKVREENGETTVTMLVKMPIFCIIVSFIFRIITFLLTLSAVMLVIAGIVSLAAGSDASYILDGILGLFAYPTYRIFLHFCYDRVAAEMKKMIEELLVY